MRFLDTTIAPYLTLQPILDLHTSINYLESARAQSVIDVQIILLILAIENLSYRWCLNDGLTEQQLWDMNIEQKLNRMRKKVFPKLETRYTDPALRKDVRNPLMHTGHIPAMTFDEKVQWADDLYALAFKMICTLVGFKGMFLDPMGKGAFEQASLA